MLVAAIELYGLAHGSPWCDKGAATGKMWVSMQALGIKKLVGKVRALARKNHNSRHATITKLKLMISSSSGSEAGLSFPTFDSSSDEECADNQDLMAAGSDCEHKLPAELMEAGSDGEKESSAELLAAGRACEEEPPAEMTPAGESSEAELSAGLTAVDLSAAGEDNKHEPSTSVDHLLSSVRHDVLLQLLLQEEASDVGHLLASGDIDAVLAALDASSECSGPHDAVGDDIAAELLATVDGQILLQALLDDVRGNFGQHVSESQCSNTRPQQTRCLSADPIDQSPNSKPNRQRMQTKPTMRWAERRHGAQQRHAPSEDAAAPSRVPFRATLQT